VDVPTGPFAKGRELQKLKPAILLADPLESTVDIHVGPAHHRNDLTLIAFDPHFKS
jgi:hypothetical protein